MGCDGFDTLIHLNTIHFTYLSTMPFKLLKYDMSPDKTLFIVLVCFTVLHLGRPTLFSKQVMSPRMIHLIKQVNSTCLKCCIQVVNFDSFIKWAMFRLD